jgi:hypothetical protein
MNQGLTCDAANRWAAAYVYDQPPCERLSSGRANSSIAVEKQRVHFALDTPPSRTIAIISLATFVDSGISALRFLTYSQLWPGGGGWRLPATINSSQVQSPLFLLDLLAVLLLLSSRFVE